jgi:hypothetical protein
MKMVTKKAMRIVTLAIVVIALLAGCGGNAASWKKHAYDGLYAAMETYESTRAALNALPDGKISEKDKQKIEEAAKAYRDAYHLAIDSIILYDQGIIGGETIDEKIAAAAKLFTEFLNAVIPYLEVKHEPQKS